MILTGASVILADNDAVLRNVIRSMLENAHHHVFVARDGQEAVGLAQQVKADLALLDIAMPNLNGIAACKVIRALPGYGEVPIIMLTGYGDQRTRAAAGQAGASAFVTKPFQPDLLLDLVGTCLARSPRARPAVSGAGAADPGPVSSLATTMQPPSGGGLDTIRIYRRLDRIKASDPKRPMF